MTIVDLFLISIYTHFCEMKEKGRSVVPWFQTVSALSLFTAISSVLIAKIFFGNNFSNKTISESFFLFFFFFIGIICFFFIKHYLFNSGRHLILSENYIEKYSSKKRLLFKTLSIGVLLLIPVLLGLIIWINAV